MPRSMVAAAAELLERQMARQWSALPPPQAPQHQTQPAAIVPTAALRAQCIRLLEQVAAEEERIASRWLRQSVEALRQRADERAAPSPLPLNAVTTGPYNSRPIPEPTGITEERVERIMEARKRYLEYQAHLDGVLVAASPAFDPVTTTEEVADMLVEDLLEEGARELFGLCDEYTDKLLAAEFG